MAMAHLAVSGPNAQAPDACSQISLPGIDVLVDLQGFIDVDAEIARNEKEQKRLERTIDGKEKKLANESFVQRAPAEIVENERMSLRKLREQLSSIEDALADLRRNS